jgi:hypothetical protein|tara:strand:+ start:325 stop:567 length:243 start_codon:yes stop_codon:yes gene_type:complete
MEKPIGSPKRHGGVSPPGKRALRMNQMPVDPEAEDFDELMNPVDYFNIYKREMEKLAYQKFDLDQDKVFYSYLDKLTNKE